VSLGTVPVGQSVLYVVFLENTHITKSPQSDKIALHCHTPELATLPSHRPKSRSLILTTTSTDVRTTHHANKILPHPSSPSQLRLPLTYCPNPLYDNQSPPKISLTWAPSPVSEPVIQRSSDVGHRPLPCQSARHVCPSWKEAKEGLSDGIWHPCCYRPWLVSRAVTRGRAKQ
jgi:hypothetical protein